MRNSGGDLSAPRQHFAGRYQPGGDAFCTMAQAGGARPAFASRKPGMDHARRCVERAFVFRLRRHKGKHGN